MANSSDSYNKNIAGNTPAQLLASVLEQRYSKSTCTGGKRDSVPDPLSFPAMRKALGPVYSDFAEIVQEEAEAFRKEEAEQTAERVDMRGAVREMTGQLMELVDSIEVSDEHKREEQAHYVRKVIEKKNDPYNREYNFEQIPDREENEITEIAMPTIEMETFTPAPRQHRKFRNGAKAE